MSPTRLALFADDLTGACDAGVPFVLHGRTARVHLDISNPASAAEVEIFNMASRGLPASEAMVRLRSLLRGCGGRAVFLKIDSLLRGNHGPELHAAVEELRPQLVVLSPAFPAQGRTVLDGELHVHGTRHSDLHRAFAGFRCAVVPGPRLQDVALAERALRQLPEAAQVALIDATEQRNLDVAVCAALRLGQNILWVGSSGLARSLAAVLAGPGTHTHTALPMDDRPMLLAIGSQDPVTLDQLAHLASQTLEGPPPVLLSLSRSFTRDDLNRFFAENPLHGISSVLLSGGDTASRFLHVLDATGIALAGEVQPGVPWGRIVGGAADGLPVITKSGAFGAPDCLSACVTALHPSAKSIAHEAYA